jgi:hypothetical protein
MSACRTAVCQGSKQPQPSPSMSSILVRIVHASTRRARRSGVELAGAEKRWGRERASKRALADCSVARRLVLQESAARCLHTSRRTTASSCSLLDIPSTRSDQPCPILLYSILLPYHTTKTISPYQQYLDLEPIHLIPLLSAPTHTVSNNTRLPYCTASRVNTAQNTRADTDGMDVAAS